MITDTQTIMAILKTNKNILRALTNRQTDKQMDKQTHRPIILPLPLTREVNMLQSEFLQSEKPDKRANVRS